MTVPPYWIRLSIDVDPALNPIGASLELHTDGEVQALIVTAVPDPFDNCQVVLERLLSECIDRWGHQRPLL